MDCLYSVAGKGRVSIVSSVVRVVRVAIIPDSLGKGEAIPHAYECLRGAGIRPLGCEVTEPAILVAPETREKALAALISAGFEIKEL
jgi:hypothetical protein